MSSPRPPEQSPPNPPFPPAGVAPHSRSPPPEHPDAEAFVNAAAQHVFPEHPAPRKGEDIEEDVKRDGVDDVNAKEEEREEEPLIGGTPLEEMKTPMRERGSFFGSRPTRMRGRATDASRGNVPQIQVPKEVPEDEELDDITPVVSKGAKGGRPGFSAMRDMGSVSDFHSRRSLRSPSASRQGLSASLFCCRPPLEPPPCLEPIPLTSVSMLAFADRNFPPFFLPFNYILP